MNFTTLLLANFYLGCWMLLYYLAFSRKTTFSYNRLVLLGGIILSFVLPFIALPSISLFSVADSAASLITAKGGSAMVIADPTASEAVTFPVWQMFLWVYWSGVVLLGVLFVGKLAKIRHYVKKFPQVKHDGYIQVQTPVHWEAFSFLHFLFAPVNTPKSVVEHEKVHIRQRHSIDNILTELVKVFCWFNPAVYSCQKALKMEHEYLADAATVKIVDVREYAQKLVNQSFKLSNLSLVHPFLNRSHIQKRLIMLQKNGTSRKSIWTYLFLIPALAGIMLFASSFSLKNKVQDAIAGLRPVELDADNTVAGPQDTLIEGTLRSSSGEPVAGANIIVEGSQKGTTTNDKGQFQLTGVAPGTILHISSIGYNSITIQVPDSNNHFDIVLYRKPTALKNLTVTGYTNDTLPAPAQIQRNTTASDNNKVFQFVEQMPQFPGGQVALINYLSSHVKYPKEAREKGIQGTVVVQFVVQKDGSIVHVKTVGKQKGGGLEEEAIRLVKQMPKWIPGKQNKRHVRVQFSLPIRFKLNGPVNEQPPLKNKMPPPPPALRPAKNKGEVYRSVEHMPQFPGGKEALMTYLSQNMKYPAEARKEGIEGTIVIQFVVGKDGSLTNIQAVGSREGGGLEEESIRVIKAMPNWLPGKQDGKPVKVLFNLPIRFKLT